MTIPRLQALTALWKENPPLVLTAHYIARFLGMKSQEAKISELDESGQSLFDMCPQTPKR